MQMRFPPNRRDKSPYPAGTRQEGESSCRDDGLDQTQSWLWKGGMIPPMGVKLIVFLVAIVLAFLGIDFDP